MPGIATEPPLLNDTLPAPNFGYEPAPPGGMRHWAYVAAGSLTAHVFLLILGLMVASLPGPPRRTAGEVHIEIRPQQVTKLVAPPLEVLTQRAPNQTKPALEFNAASLPPRPAQPNVPQNPGAAALPRQKFQLPDQKTPETPKPILPDVPAPPPVDSAQIRTNTPPPALGTPQSQFPAPQIEAQEKPKLAFERPGAQTGTSSVNNGLGRPSLQRAPSTIDDLARQAARSSGKGLAVGDEDAIPGASPAAPSTALPGKLGSAVELLSDPQGVDFWPYLVKVLTTVRRNWFAVIPESARFGRQGRTVIQFAINRDGSVPKLVIATPSGADALDRAAVASISASNPFIPLPAEFKGGQIRLQFVFKYNVK